MKKNVINTRHQQLIIGYQEWLQARGYASQTVYDSPRKIRELLLWLESQHTTLEATNNVTPFLGYLQQRRNYRRASGALKPTTIN